MQADSNANKINLTNLATDASLLYNGNIYSMVTTIINPDNNAVMPQLTAYRVIQVSNFTHTFGNKNYTGANHFGINISDKKYTEAWINLGINVISLGATSKIKGIPGLNDADKIILEGTKDVFFEIGKKTKDAA